MARKTNTLLTFAALGVGGYLTWNAFFGRKARVAAAIGEPLGPYLDFSLDAATLAMANEAVLLDLNEEPVIEAWVVRPEGDEPSLAATYDTPLERILVLGPTTLAGLLETGSFAVPPPAGAEMLTYAGWKTM